MQLPDQALLAAILRTAVDAIIVIDSQGRIETVNSATTRLFGYQENELLHHNVNMLMPQPDRSQHNGYLHRYHDSGKANVIGIGREVIGQRKDGTTFPMHVAISEVPFEDQTMYAGIIRDISDLKAVQQELMEANTQLAGLVRQRTDELREAQAELVRAEKLALLGQVSGGIAHEIRNPLNVVRTSTYFLLNAPDPSGTKIAEHLERIERQVTLIDHVITALCDIARLPEPNVEQCNVAHLISEVVPSVSLASNIEIQVDISEEPPLCVVIDANQILIVLRNLIRNARDAMAAGGTIVISATPSDDEVVIHVSDTGIGIPSAQIERVTQPLYSTKMDGMGMGLSVSAAIIEKNKAQLNIVSEVGKGTTFSLHLPIHQSKR